VNDTIISAYTIIIRIPACYWVKNELQMKQNTNQKDKQFTNS